jgi:hypothetical protein
MQRVLYQILFLILILLGLNTASASSNAAANKDYVSDIQAEKEELFYEVYMITPEPKKETALKELIFNQQLSKEFKNKYREKFGELDTESIVYQPTKFNQIDENRGANQKIETANSKRKEFGEFMIKRLSEWHVDNYFKTDPTMRPVYELKEKLSNVEVQVTKQTKINIQYSLSSNEADLVIDNPYFDKSKVTLVMNSKQFGPGPVEDQKIIAEKLIDKKLRLNNSLTVKDGIAKTELIRFLKLNWATSMGISAAYKDGTPSPRETRYLVGVTRSW